MQIRYDGAMAKVTVYTMESCPYCLRAKDLLKQRGIAFQEKLLPMDDDGAWEELEKKSGMKTMPQIFSGETLVGGYRELADLDQKDQLASLK
jgi:glutaredoxin 3